MTPRTYSKSKPPRKLLPQHAALLKASAILPAVAKARGYWSATKPEELARLGFNAAQRVLVPALVIPIHTVNGELAFHQIRPDAPRTLDRESKRYEQPAGTRVVIDVPPGSRAALRDPKVPLWITEGARKSDAAASAGLCCISLSGVWSWKNKAVLPDWDSIALKGGRVVFIAYDSDATTKNQVRLAETRLAAMLESRGAIVTRVRLPAGPDSEKVGLDDYLAKHGREALLALAEECKHRPLELGLGGYGVVDGVLTHFKVTREGVIPQRLANFAARIAAEEVRDDGAEHELRLRIEGSLAAGEPLPAAMIPAGRFAALDWVIHAWGARAIVTAGQATKDHLRAAIQTLSDGVERRTVYTHLGWRKLGERWAYLHAGGALGPGGPTPGIEVDPPGPLARFVLPAPPEGEALRGAVQASLGLLGVAPDRVAIPLHAAVWRAVLGGADFGMHLTGPTGAGKTELGALAQQHYGAGLDRLHLPGSWTSTANSLEGLMWSASDALLVVDDFAPRGSQVDVQRMHREADRVFRAQGNHSGRGRMRADGSLRPVKPPRCFTLSTGEDTPAGQSLRARMLVVEVGPTDVDWDQITKLQHAAADGLLAQSLAGFVQWCAPRLDELRAELREGAQGWRDRSLAHRRTADALGALAAAHGVFRRFAVKVKAITKGEATALGRRVEGALLEVGAAQAAQQHSEDPVRRFFELLAGAIASGRAHVANANPSPTPFDLERWGGVDGTRIGWVRGWDLFLQPDAAFAVAQQLAGAQGGSLAISPRTLWKRMAERKLLRSSEAEHFSVKTRIGSQRPRVLHLGADALGENPEASTSSRTGATGASGAGRPSRRTSALPSPSGGPGSGLGRVGTGAANRGHPPPGPGSWPRSETSNRGQKRAGDARARSAAPKGPGGPGGPGSERVGSP